MSIKFSQETNCHVGLTFCLFTSGVLVMYFNANFVRVVAKAAPTKKSPSIMYCLMGGLGEKKNKNRTVNYSYLITGQIMQI